MITIPHIRNLRASFVRGAHDLENLSIHTWGPDRYCKMAGKDADQPRTDIKKKLSKYQTDSGGRTWDVLKVEDAQLVSKLLFFSLMMVPSQCTSRRNHTLNFEHWPFPGLAVCGTIPTPAAAASCSSEPASLTQEAATSTLQCVVSLTYNSR